jgi:hypothetical protein
MMKTDSSFYRYPVVGGEARNKTMKINKGGVPST